MTWIIMKKNFSILLALLGWFAIIAQYILALDNRITSVAEASIRFFSYFTILTNILVASYFTATFLNIRFSKNKNVLSAITVYILIVGIVYQIVLRAIWEPQGLQKVVDELLHSVIPVGVLIYWFFYDKNHLKYTEIVTWSIYPLVYLILVLSRGKISGFYPYPFLNVSEIGYSKTLLNSFFILVLFFILSALLVFTNQKLKRLNKTL